ncbi:potassium channel family protein [Shimia biformata]|uniref:potassium channel family protein n=1 Tax=Shimia biformata TaxID=1294299 RepID=UPI00194F99AB|nr:potassium channel family protein [Shimia biformata]
MTPRERLVFLIGMLIPIIGGGTVFFRYVEGWSWVDAYFFSVITLSTVGYGHPVPDTNIGKIGTTVFVFIGLGIFALVIQQVAEVASHRRRKGRSRWLLSGRSKEDETSLRADVANEDEKPDE